MFTGATLAQVGQFCCTDFSGCFAGLELVSLDVRAVGQFGNARQNIITLFTACTSYKAHVYVRRIIELHERYGIKRKYKVPQVARDLWSGTTPIRSCMVDYEWLRRRPESSARGGTGKRESFEACRN